MSDTIPLRPVPNQAGNPPSRSVARSHTSETFPKAFPVLLASGQAVTLVPSCVFHKHTRGPKGTRIPALPLGELPKRERVMTPMRSVTPVQWDALTLKPVTDWWRRHRRISLPLFLLPSASPWKYLGSRLNRTHMLRRASGKGTSVVVSGCGQTVSFRQDGLWQHNGLVVGRMNELPVTCGQGLPKLDRASERHVVT